MMKSKELTKGLGYWQNVEERTKNPNKTEYEIARDEGFINDMDKIDTSS